MAGIQEYLDKIKNAVYGREVRQAIHDGIEECYKDGKAGAVDLVARQQIAELVAPSGEAPSAAEVTDARIGADGVTYTSLGLANRTQFYNLENAVNTGVEVIRSGNTSYTVSQGTSSFVRNIFTLELAAGTYEVSCSQDVTLSSTDRNRFYYTKNGRSVYEPSDNLDSGIHTWRFTLTEDGEYTLSIWVANPSQNVTISDFLLIRKNPIYAIGAQSARHDIVAFVGNEIPVFNVDSSNAITVTFPATSILVSYQESYYTYRVWRYIERRQTSITVADLDLLVFDMDAEEFVVRTETSYNPNNREIICFLNHRGVIYGQWNRYKVDNKISLLEESIPHVLPNYYDSYISSKIDEVNMNLMEAKDGDSFVFITDIHIDGNAGNSPNLIKKIINGCSVNKIFLNGDYIQQEASKTAALKKINNVINSYIFPNAETFATEGNHEFNTNGSISPAPELTWEELYYAIVKGKENTVVRQDDGLGFYWVNEAQKIKYMVATFNKSSGMDHASVSFIIENLMNTPSGYTIVFFNHGGIRSDLTYQSGFDEIVSAFDAIRTRSTIAFDGRTYDFTDADYTVACMLTGHYHQDFYKMSDSGLPIVSTTCDSYLYNEDQNVTRALGTVSEQAFDVYTFNKTANTLKAIRIGGGHNRSFHIEQVNVTSSIQLESSLEGSLTWGTLDSSKATVSNGTVSRVTTGATTIYAMDANGNIEVWSVLCS